MRALVKDMVRTAARIKPVASLARIIHDDSDRRDTVGFLTRRFLKNGDRARRDIVRRFETISDKVPAATSFTDGLFLAEMILNLRADGPIVECGCYAGASSAKLSILAKLTGRELIICDSFEGLPVVDAYNLTDHNLRRAAGWLVDWSAGRYAVRLEEVKENIATYGELSVCRFVRGWFNETLNDGNLPAKIAFAFTDVDIPSSARDCLISLWPRLKNSGVYVTHDTAFVKVLLELYSHDLWTQLGEFPPILFGAGFGLCNDSPHIGYMVKGNADPEYLKSLTIDK